MLTGTREIPEERRGEKKDGGEKEKKNKNTEEKTQKEPCPSMLQKGLSGLFSSHGVILIRPRSSNLPFLIRACTVGDEVHAGVEITNLCILPPTVMKCGVTKRN